MTENPRCEAARRLLAAEQDRGLDADERDRVRLHLEDCAACREVARWIVEVDALVAEEESPLLSRIEAARLAEDLRRRLKPSRRRSFVGAPPVWVAAAALALMLGVLSTRRIEETPVMEVPDHARGGREATIHFQVEGESTRERLQPPESPSAQGTSVADEATPAPATPVPQAPGSEKLARGGSHEAVPSAERVPRADTAQPTLERLAAAAGSPDSPGEGAGAEDLRRALARGRPALLRLSLRPVAEDLPTALVDSLRAAWSVLLEEDIPDSDRVRLRRALERLGPAHRRE